MDFSVDERLARASRTALCRLGSDARGYVVSLQHAPAFQNRPPLYLCVPRLHSSPRNFRSAPKNEPADAHYITGCLKFPLSYVAHVFWTTAWRLRECPCLYIASPARATNMPVHVRSDLRCSRWKFQMLKGVIRSIGKILHFRNFFMSLGISY